DRAAAIAGHGVLDRFMTNLAGLALINVRNATGKAALYIAESIAAHALVVEPVLYKLGQIISQRAAAQLEIAVGILLQLFGEAFGNRNILAVGDPLGDSHHTAAIPLHVVFHIRK